jgi:predicted MFS family arabinose efflux permease
MGGLGSVVGLLLGGVLTQYLDWRWVLFVNVPIAVAVLAGTAVLVAGERDRGRVDLPGALTATLGLGSLVFAINRAQTHGWTATSTLGLFAVSAALLAVFVLVQRRSPVAMLPPGILRDRGRAGAYAVLFLAGAGMFATFFFLTLYMQGVKGYTPMRTGFAYLPFALGIGLAAGGLGPRLVVRFAERTVAVGGLVLATLGMAWLTRLAPDTGYAAVLLPAQFVAGLGLGLALVTMTIAGVRGVGHRDTGIASGLLNTSQQIGGALGLAVLAAVASAATDNPALVGSVTDGYSAALLAGGVLYLAAVVVAAVLVGRQAGDRLAPAGG